MLAPTVIGQTSQSRRVKGQADTRTFDELLAGILRRESLSVLTGDIGMGKTTLCRAVIESLDRKTFSAIVPDPFASREDLLKILLMDFGVMSMADLTSGRPKGAPPTRPSPLPHAFPLSSPSHAESAPRDSPNRWRGSTTFPG